MTQVITRYFEDVNAAGAVKRALHSKGFPLSDLRLLTEAKSATRALSNARVLPKSIKAYEKKLAKGGAVLLAKATFKPLGAAQLVRSMTSEMGAAVMKGAVEEVYVIDKPGRPRPILSAHPRMMTRKRQAQSSTFHMANWPIQLLSKRKPKDEFAFPRHSRMASFPIPLLSRRKPGDAFAFPRHARMANFPIPLISKRKPKDNFAFPRHARMADVILPLISKRKPYSDSFIPRHGRMATVPFPLLINGRTGVHALVPGAPRMAAYPVPLLSDRKPSDSFAFPRHARMAAFPLPLISRRKPFTGSMIPKHGRMADAILPLIVKHGAGRAGEGFSFSKLLGWSTPSGK